MTRREREFQGLRGSPEGRGYVAYGMENHSFGVSTKDSAGFTAFAGVKLGRRRQRGGRAAPPRGITHGA